MSDEDFVLEEGESYRYCDFCGRQKLGHNVIRNGSKRWSCYFCIAKNIEDRGREGEEYLKSQNEKGFKLSIYGTFE
jgi:hypothetical protein